MKPPFSLIVLLAGTISWASNEPKDSSKACKPVKQYGVSGCELLSDRTCPPGYHKEVVNPPDPRMKAPSHLMCVRDKPAPDKAPAKDPANPTIPE